MKKVIISILLAILSLSAFSQTSLGTWDANTATYTNNIHKISWTLPKDYNWVNDKATNASISFKAVSEDIGCMLTINIHTDRKYGDDIWPNYAYYNSKEYFDGANKAMSAVGVELKSVEWVKSQICGIHALKSTSIIEREERPLGKIDILGIVYEFYFEGKSYSISLQVPKLIYDANDDYGFVINQLIKGIKINR